jgi:hypothetical protein
MPILDIQRQRRCLLNIYNPVLTWTAEHEGSILEKLPRLFAVVEKASRHRSIYRSENPIIYGTNKSSQAMVCRIIIYGT